MSREEAKLILRKLTSIERKLADSATANAVTVRGDRAAMKIVGFRSPGRFSEWAISKGLKSPVKATAQERTVYSVADLKRAALSDRDPAAKANFR